MKTKYIDKPFMKEVFYKALPLIIATIVNSLITLVDNWMISIMQAPGSDELAAAALASKYINIVIIFLNAAIAMFSFLVFQYKGKGDIAKVKSTFKLMIQFTSVIAIAAILVAQFAANDIMKFFQGSNYSHDVSTVNGIAQSYMKALTWKVIPLCFFSVFVIGLNAYGKQKILIPLTMLSIGINALLNYVFYESLDMGLNGVAYSTIVADSVILVAVLIWINIYKLKILFNPLTVFTIDSHVLAVGLKRYMMAFQVVLWSSISMGTKIIYSRWYGDVANNALAIAAPIVAMFYVALDGIAATKGYFVGVPIGKGDKEAALTADKRINLYTGVVALIEGVLLMAFAWLMPLAFVNASDDTHFNASLLLVFVGATYPIAAMSKCMLGSFKVAGMGKTIVLSNGLFALFFEFIIPLILFILHQNGIVEMKFWQLYLLARCVKLLKLPPTLYFWRKKIWLERAV